MKDYILGVEIGGTKLQLGIADFDGELIFSHKGNVNPSDGIAGILDWLKRNIPSVIERAPGGKVQGAGVGFGGPIETSKGRVLASIQIKGWEKFEIKEWFEGNFSLPVSVANDSNAACWGEYCRGTGIGTKQFCYMNIGSGLGGGLVINGKLYDGQGYGASEIGQTYVPDWTAEYPGAARRLELLCSGWAIEKRLRSPGYIEKDSMILEICSNVYENVTCAMLGKAAELGDSFALNELDSVAKSIGLALSNVLSLVNPEFIAIGGGVSKLGETIIAPIRRYTNEFDFISSKGHYRIGRCILDESIVLIGAILLLRDDLMKR